MKGYETFIVHLSKVIDFFYKSIILSILFLMNNIFLILFLLTFKDLTHLVGIIISVILSITIFPSYCALLYAACHSTKVVRSYFNFYTIHWRIAFLGSIDFIVVLGILVVDSLFFVRQGIIVLEFLFTGLSIGVLVFAFNTAYVVSVFDTNLNNMIKITLAYTKELTTASLMSICILAIPLFVRNYFGPLLIFVVIGAAGLVHSFASGLAHQLMIETISDDTIKYL